MHPDANEKGVTAGITNTRLSAVKRGIAVEAALRLAVECQHEVCLVGADPTDRDVQRRLPQLLADDTYRRMGIRHGPYEIDVVRLFGRRLTVVMLSDRAMVEPVLSRLQQEFPYIVVDAPSRVGNGVGIARVLLPFLDGLVVASGMRAGDLALTQGYVRALQAMPVARHVQVSVLATGSPAESGFAREQLERKLEQLPLVGDHTAGDRNIDTLVDWIMRLRDARPVTPATVSAP